MPGTFDNEAGVYLFEEWYDEGDWFEDTKGFLYIMPTDEYADEYGSAESIGPDNETEDWLNAYYRDYEECPSEDNLAAHGLVKIPAVLQRFDPDCGYYHA